ncbi:hypothetical protein FNH25_09870 [Morganella morganii]|nr:hypothetical protein [Morganella morganii]
MKTTDLHLVQIITAAGHNPSDITAEFLMLPEQHKKNIGIADILTVKKCRSNHDRHTLQIRNQNRSGFTHINTEL